MRISEFSPIYPKWAFDNMMLHCKYCGSYILDNSDTGKVTARWCANPKCPGHMMHRCKVLVDFFGVKGIGPETCLNLITGNNWTSHFDIIPFILKDKKPRLSLSEIATLACIEGYGATQAQKELDCFASFEDYFNSKGTKNELLLNNKDMLIDCQKYFEIKPPRSSTKLLVMGTGSFNGYSSREQYFNMLNDIFGQYVNIIQSGKRKTGICFLIKEPNAVDHSKSQIARENNIPIVTPDEFIALLLDRYPYAFEEYKERVNSLK